MLLTVSGLASASKRPWPLARSWAWTQDTAGWRKAGDSATWSSRKFGATSRHEPKRSGRSRAATRPEMQPMELQTRAQEPDCGFTTASAKSVSWSAHVKKL